MKTRRAMPIFRPNPMTCAASILVLLVLGACARGPERQISSGASDEDSPTGIVDAELSELADEYLAQYFETFPSRATASGLHTLDRQLEDLSPERLDRWIGLNRGHEERLEARLASGELSTADRHDAELLLRQVAIELFEHDAQRRAERDPLFWTGIASRANVHLLVRDDLPLEERLSAAVARADQLPRLVEQARGSLGRGGSDRHSAEIFEIAARQTRATAEFYRSGFGRAAEGRVAADAAETLGAELARAGSLAAGALDELAAFLDETATMAEGSPHLGPRYEERFRKVLGIDRDVAEVLVEARAALSAKRQEAAEYARSIWQQVMTGAPPENEAELVRALFRRAGDDHADSVDEFVSDYVRLVDEAVTFVREHEVVTLPGELTLHTDRSPSYFVGQSVGGVYPAGPYAPDADTLFYLPTPSDDASESQRESFFRDFNDHFNVMIVPHEIVPGHYTQLKIAARQERRVRALFGDGAFTEGWGTFSERLLLDLGWGTPLARVAHLKKQMENIARTIVDISVHTDGMTREEVLRFVQEEALQEAQFAGNMWSRSITSAPQLTFYWLGYEQVRGLYLRERERQGEAFVLRDFVDAILAQGSIPVSAHAEELSAR